MYIRLTSQYIILAKLYDMKNLVKYKFIRFEYITRACGGLLNESILKNLKLQGGTKMSNNEVLITGASAGIGEATCV